MLDPQFSYDDIMHTTVDILPRVRFIEAETKSITYVLHPESTSSIVKTLKVVESLYTNVHNPEYHTHTHTPETNLLF